MKNQFWQGFWRLADPKISLASFASMFLGACIAAASGPIHFGWLALNVLGIFAIEVAKNASGDIFDFDSGDDQAIQPEDRTPFSGGKRVLLDGLLKRRKHMDICAQVSMVFHLDKHFGVFTRDTYCVVHKMEKLEW